MPFPVHTWPQVKQLLGTCLIISQVRNNSWRRAGSYLPFHQVGVLRETPPLLETLQEPPVADDARPELPRDVVLLPLEPPAHLPARSPRTRFNFTPRGTKSTEEKPARRQQAMRSGVPGGWWTCSWLRRNWRRTPRWAWWACAARRRGTRSPSRPRTPSPRPPWLPAGAGRIGERELPLGRVRRGRRRRNTDRRCTAAMWPCGVGKKFLEAFEISFVFSRFPLFRWNFQGSRGGAEYSPKFDGPFVWSWGRGRCLCCVAKSVRKNSCCFSDRK